MTSLFDVFFVVQRFAWAPKSWFIEAHGTGVSVVVLLLSGETLLQGNNLTGHSNVEPRFLHVARPLLHLDTTSDRSYVIVCY